jgi:hypothetical protein
MRVTSRFRSALAFCAFLALAPGQLAAQDYQTWYLAEGSTFTFEQEILIANPNAFPVTVNVWLLPKEGGRFQLENLQQLPAFSRQTIRVHDYVVGRDVSAEIRAVEGAILIERSMYWGGAQRRGGHSSAGTTGPSTNWYFAEGALGMFQTYLLIGNPGIVPANVTVRYLKAEGGTPVLDERVVQPGQRLTIPVHVDQPHIATGPAFGFAMHVTSDQPVLAERAMYWQGFGGGHAAIGVTQPRAMWRFAEGSTRNVMGFTTYVLLSNPGADAANVTVRFFRDDGGAPIDRAVAVAARSRVTLPVNIDVPELADSSFSFVVQSDRPIVAERAMYWGNFVEGHVTAGAEQEATAWGFAEGLEDRHAGLDYDTYYLFVNSNSTQINLTGTFYREDGQGVQVNIPIPANSRQTLAARTIPELTNQRFAAFFQSDGLPFVAERAVYWGWPYRGGHVSVGTPWIAAIPVPPIPLQASISEVTPRVGSRMGGNEVVIHGSNFTQGSRVFFGNTEATILGWQPDSIRVAVPANPVGSWTVTVLGGYSSPPQLPGGFSYLNAAANGPAAITYPETRHMPNFLHGVNVAAVVGNLAAERFDLLLSSCAEKGGNNQFMFEVVRRLRQATGSNRWGLNWKRGTTGDLSQDVVSYYWGPEGVEMEGNRNVFLVDIIFRHCGPEYGVGNPGPNWEDVTDITYRGGSIGRWTGYGRFF